MGSGKDGAATISGTINRYTPLAANAAAGATSLSVGSAAGFAAGDIIMIFQTTGLAATSGNQASVTLSSSTSAGRYELAAITGVSGNTFALDAGLLYSYAAGSTQVIRVPQYTTVTVAGTVTAQAWNGQTGGVVAFLATGAVTNSGSISASGLGFRGGVLGNANQDYFGCNEADAPANKTFGSTGYAVTYSIDAWAKKGEGLDAAAYTATAGTADELTRGRGNSANGAGGGDCDNAGGGGGSNTAIGGQGGNSWSGDGVGSEESHQECSRYYGNGTCRTYIDVGNYAVADTTHTGRAVGGLGGAPLSYSPLDHLVLGGGGGAGQENDGVGGVGGSGGGVVFIRALSLSGGSISANGSNGGNAGNAANNNGKDGAGGGGAAGTIYVRLEQGCTGTALSANGGNGGTVYYSSDDHGPGGGGSAGRILYQSTSTLNAGGSCTTTITPGSNGTWNGTTKNASPAGSTPASATTILAGGFTAVTLLHFAHAPARLGGEEIAWETGSEQGTLGFFVRRGSAHGPRVNADLVRGHFDSPVGARYRVVDPEGRPDTAYFLEELARDGVHTYGPAHRGREADWSVRRERTPVIQRTLVAPLQMRHPGPARRPTDGYARVDHEGLYAFTPADLNAAGVTTSGTLALQREGQPRPLFRRPDGSWLFYAGPVDSPDRAQDAYHLGSGRSAAARERAALPPTSPRAASFADTVHFEGHTFIDPGAPVEQRFPWAMLYSGGGPTTLTFDAPTLVSASSISFELRGLIEFGQAREHHVRVTLNGTPILEQVWGGGDEVSASATLPAALLQPTGNQLTFEDVEDLGLPYDLVAVSSFDVTGERAYRAEGDALAFTAPRKRTVFVKGFSAIPEVMDVTDPARPERLTHVVPVPAADGTFGVRFGTPPGGGTRRYFAAVPQEPALTRSRAGEVPAGPADEVIITGPGLGAQVAPLVAARAAEGLRAVQVDAEAIYDGFGFGDHGPAALHRYLSQLTPAPRYVLLVGKPSDDPRGYLPNDPPDLVPTTFPFEAGWARFAVADAPLVAGPDGRTPFAAIGRLPVRDANELQAWVQKLVAHAAAPGASSGLSTWVADAVDPATGGDDPFFRTESERLIQGWPGLNPTRIYLPQASKADLLAALAQQPDLVVYHGHADALDWSQTGILRSSDLAALPAARPFLLVTVDCYDGLFAEPSVDPLAQQLAEVEGGGAIAAFSASTLVDEQLDSQLDDALFPALQTPGLQRVGDFTLQAARNLAALRGPAASLLGDYNLIGDPASPMPLR